ncbi:MAG: S-methyl-5-thioribose-1-phosphate isomerase [Methylobacterium sp.]|nr:S-methyl-5-thioribose-1-phosphate isomerase [Methylobacterium sp.]
MRIRGLHYRTIWPADTEDAVDIIDQTALPHRFDVLRLKTLAEMVQAIKTMQVRGAPLIGAAAAYGMALALREQADDDRLRQVGRILCGSRPTAVNLRWAVQRMEQRLLKVPVSQRADAAWQEAACICDEDVRQNEAIGNHGLALLQAMHQKRGRTLNVLTHCNAGWLATVDWGTALAPVYRAFDSGIPVHVWVDETRPRNQGASLTAWELAQHGVPHTVIVDNAGGHLMQHGQVDMVLVGADRVTACGDVCNKIGTYLKALAAHDNQLPFYAAVPSPTIDWNMRDGLREIPIEQRDPEEVAAISGRLPDGSIAGVALLAEGSRAANPAFDVTPARLVSGIITERGVAKPARLATLFMKQGEAPA